MKNIANSIKVYIGLIIILSISAFVYVLLPMGEFMSGQEFPAPKSIIALINALVMLLVYGGLGLLGLHLATKNGFTAVWNEKIKEKRTIFKLSLVGIGIGLFFIIIDIVVNKIFLLPLLEPVDTKSVRQI
jgi:hypothetical protein